MKDDGLLFSSFCLAFCVTCDCKTVIDMPHLTFDTDSILYRYRAKCACHCKLTAMTHQTNDEPPLCIAYVNLAAVRDGVRR